MLLSMPNGCTPLITFASQSSGMVLKLPLIDGKYFAIQSSTWPFSAAMLALALSLPLNRSLNCGGAPTESVGTW